MCFFCESLISSPHPLLTHSHQLTHLKATQYGVPVKLAIESTNATCNKSGMYQRVKRWKDRNMNGNVSGLDISEVNIPPVAAMAAVAIATNSVRSDIAESPAASSISTLTPTSLEQQHSAYIDRLPDWCDKSKSLIKRKLRTGAQAAYERNRNMMEKEYRDNRYKEAYKRLRLHLPHQQTLVHVAMDCVL